MRIDGTPLVFKSISEEYWNKQPYRKLADYLQNQVREDGRKIEFTPIDQTSVVEFFVYTLSVRLLPMLSDPLKAEIGEVVSSRSFPVPVIPEREGMRFNIPIYEPLSTRLMTEEVLPTPAEYWTFQLEHHLYGNTDKPPVEAWFWRRI